MRSWEYGLLFLLGLALTVGIAVLQPAPGYMDADYYYAGGIQLAAGQGLSEPFLWNYLDEPKTLPHPAFAYWMPLASMLAALGMTLTGKQDYFSARLVFILLAAFIPPLTAWLTFRMTAKRITAWTAGGLAVFSGFYAVYLGLTETFTIYMLVGTIFLVVSASSLPLFGKAAALGLLAGLMHLARADGILWLVLGFFVILPIDQFSFIRQNWRWTISLSVLLATTYLLVMAFWYGRNLFVFGGIFPPGSSRAIWLVDYDQLYSFPPFELNAQTWAAAGWGPLLTQRWDAFLSNLQTMAAVQGEIFLFPLIVVGLFRTRVQTVTRLGVGMWCVTLLIMTLVFPLPGARGGFLHSAAAFQPLFWAAGAEGLVGFVELGMRWRNWKLTRASVGFGILIVAVAMVFTAGLSAARLAGDAPGQSGWAASWNEYTAVDQILDRMNIPVETVILVNNPPGFFVASTRTCIAIPNGGLGALMAAARQFHAEYLVLEENTVKELRFLYNNPADQPGLKYLESVGKIHIFRFELQ